MNAAKPTFVIAGGFWSSNIGNAFFNLGAAYLLERSSPGARVALVSDKSAYWDFLRHRRPRNSFDLLEHLECDYLVLQGSVLGPRFEMVWSDAMKAILARGTKLILLGAGLSEHKPEDVGRCREWLKANRPYLLVARDRNSYGQFHDLAEHSYDGIDNAFFLPDAYPPLKTFLPPYVMLNFDKLVEPHVTAQRPTGDAVGEPSAPGDIRRRYRFLFEGQEWQVEFPAARFVLSRRLGKFYPFLAAPFPMGRRIAGEIGGYTIIRTNHQSNPMSLRRVFRRPNTFVSDIPHSYLNLYAQTRLVLSDRVHACVASLAYGNAAMLFSESPRSGLLDRVNVGEIRRHPVRLSQDLLQSEKAAELDYLKRLFS